MTKVSKFLFNLFHENFVQPTKMWTKTKNFVYFAKYVRNFCEICLKFLWNSQNSFKIFFSQKKIQSSWCKMKKFRFYRTKIERNFNANPSSDYRFPAKWKVVTWKFCAKKCPQKIPQFCAFHPLKPFLWNFYLIYNVEDIG